MAMCVTYSCNECDYSVDISGRSDVLFMGYTETMVCNNCKELSDYIVKTYDVKKITILTCEECGNHNITKWNYRTKPCPKCTTGKMKIDKDGSVIYAD